MAYVITNIGAKDSCFHNAYSSNLSPPIICSLCNKSDNVSISNLTTNTKIIGYCINCKSEFNIDK